MENSLRSFFEPDGVAVIGASANPNKLSNGILKNLKGSGYKKAIAPVNPKETKILGLACFSDITEVPFPVELAVIVLPSRYVPDTVEKCGQKNIRNAIVISGGFREVGEKGRLLEEEVLRIARKYEMRIIGPNCVGTVNLNKGLNTTFIKGLPSQGGIGLISQSGAVCGGIVDLIAHTGIGFSHIISLGNAADVNETDLIEYLAQDEDTNVIAAYIEGIQDGQRFVRTAKEVSKSKPIVVLRAGKSEQGAKAVSSHTGSLAGSNNAYKAAFKQAGVIEVQTTTDLLNVSNALDWMPQPKGNRIAIVTNSGGPAALASDFIAEYDCELADISLPTQEKLREKLNPSAQVENPVDMLGGADKKEFSHALRYILADDNVDMLLAILVPTSLVNPEKIAKAIADAADESGKPVLACFMGYTSIHGAQTLFGQRNIPMIDYPELCGPIFGALYQRTKKLTKESRGKKAVVKNNGGKSIKSILQENSNIATWGEHLTRPILKAYGIPLVHGEFVSGTNDLVNAANRIGFPVVLKVASRDVLHKSEFGGIITNIKDEKALRIAAEQIKKNVHKKEPDARVEGYLIEKMAPTGQEIITGFKRDPTFGPLLMFGLGGIFVELFKDVAFRVAPIEYGDASQMIMETKAYELLKGWRGGLAYDVKCIVDVLLKINQIAIDNPEITELEINPLLVLPGKSGVQALDCRLILEG